MAVIVCQKNVNLEIGNQKWSVEDAKKLAVHIASGYILDLHGPYQAVLEVIDSSEDNLIVNGDDETFTIRLDSIGPYYLGLCIEVKNNNLQSIDFSEKKISNKNLQKYLSSFKESSEST